MLSGHTFELIKDERSNTLAVRHRDTLQIIDTSQPKQLAAEPLQEADKSQLYLKTLKSFTVGVKTNKNTLLIHGMVIVTDL